jgi:exosortase A-associated hydrolase 1
MKPVEQPITFACEGSQLIGIVHQPESARTTGVLIVVGGPQYRVGSHRQFVLLARDLAGQGVPVMRFDYRAMGDSDGENIDFENIDADIGAAIDTFTQTVHGLKEIIIWGLCDAASAAAFYAHRDPRVTGLVLLNPWVRTDAGMAQAYLKHYYVKRVLSLDFWKKIITGRFEIRRSLTSLFELLGKARRTSSGADSGEADRSVPLPQRMAAGLRRFEGRVMLILSGNQDYVADEFRDVIAASSQWQQLLGRDTWERHDFPEANHTFSTSAWRDQVARWTYEWLERT